MPKINLEINTDNAAFAGENLYTELARILHKAAEDIGAGQSSGILRDINGNKVGYYIMNAQHSAEKREAQCEQ